MKNAMKGSFLASVVLNIVIQGSLAEILGMIKALQLVFHLPIMSTVAPANVISMWNIILPVVNYDVLESIPVIETLFPDSEEEMDKDKNIIDQMKDIGYDSFNVVLNLGTLFLVMCSWVLRAIL